MKCKITNNKTTTNNNDSTLNMKRLHLVCSLEGVDCVHPTASLAKGQREITRVSGKVP